jgi:predicted dehydrogenase
MDPKQPVLRRDILAAAGTVFTTSLFTGRVKGANDRIAIGFLGVGTMGTADLGYAMEVPELQPVAICDVYQPHRDRAAASAQKGGFQVKAVADFREILADRSVDAVCIATPDHWHAYMTVEACKAGKDVYVEKPASKGPDEGLKMVQAARKYNRVVQAGTMQRSGGNFRKAAELVASGALGEITFCHTFQSETTRRERYGNLPDAPVPDGLDWDMWLGPAPAVPFNPNRWGERIVFPTFRYFWDYAGGAMTDWGVHLIDPLHQCFGEVMPKSVTALGEKFYVQDNCDTPDTMHATFEYPKFLVTYGSRHLHPRHRRQPGCESARSLGDPQRRLQTVGRHLGEYSGHDAHERAALEEFRRVHQDAAETHQRYRDVRAVVVGVPVGQYFDAREDARGLGRGELDVAAGSRQTLFEDGLPQSLETGSVVG